MMGSSTATLKRCLAVQPLCVFLILITYLMHLVDSCGQITHIEISYRSLYKYSDVHGHVRYDTILRQNQDALEAGSSFPDSFYPSACFDGKFHSVSEDTHWIPFTNATIHYIQTHYSKPWNEDAQKLISFLMGVVSHQVADVSWHSLGIPQGFLKTMSYVNYHGDFPSAHKDGDLGGDVLNLYQMNLSYSNITGDWYIPLDDLVKIYKEFYGQTVINRFEILTCTKLQYLIKVAERLIVKENFPISARNSPYLVDELYSYFLGGVEDMAGWTQRIWNYITWALENGMQDCNMNHNPLFLRCNQSRDEMGTASDLSLKNGFFIQPKQEILQLLKHVVVEKTAKGVVLKTSRFLKEKLKMLDVQQETDKHTEANSKFVTEMKISEKEILLRPKAILSTKVAYAHIGSSYAVADLDGDGNEDVMIGAPGLYSSSNQQSGMVFILYGTDEGLNTSVSDIFIASDVRIPGPEDKHSVQSKFGSSLAVLDFDKDGKLDIAVGAPSFGSTDLTYTGKVYLYSLVNKTKYVLRGTVVCQDVYCNLGYSLAAGDVNSDLYDDLIIGSPFSPGCGQQRGMMAVVHSDRKYCDKSGFQIDVGWTEHIQYGNHNYSWFGYTIDIHKFMDKPFTFMAIGEPNFRNCSRPDCTYDSHDIQSIGKVHLLTAQDGNMTLLKEFTGTSKFSMLGAAVSFGRPYDKTTNILAVTASSQSVEGHVLGVPVDFPQVGSTYLFNLSNLQQPMTVFNGDRRYGRFGGQIKFADLNRDGFDDLIIGSPLRTNGITEITEAQQGQMYIYKGGPRFPMGDATSKCGLAIEPCPGQKASWVLAPEENLARFGSQFAVVKAKNKINLLVTAEQSSKYARLAGTVAVFDF